MRARSLLALVLALAAVAGCASGVTDPATDVSDGSAVLRAHGSAGGEPTEWWFDWGRTTAYGSSTPRRAGGAGTDVRSVSERIAGLQPNTEYHFRACAANRSGSGCARDRTFTTGSPGMLAGFQETTAFSGLTQPTAVRFAPDGRVFVAEKSGLVKVFGGLGDPSPSTFADLRTKVHSFWDRGLLGLALHPDFPAEPYVYVLYTHDAAIGGTAPRWGTAGASSDGCPDPPGATGDGCVVSGRLSRLRAEGDAASGAEQVLVEDWCQQYPSHSVGDLRFGADGALYASGGDGASFEFTDWGQRGSPLNPCGDPPSGSGGAQSPPAAEGGALRSQDLRTPTDPTSLDGTILRLDPRTGEGLPGNPRAGSADPAARRIVAHGLRNPFRFDVRPGTSEVWTGDVGWGRYEEINRLPMPADGTPDNFGWPCHEGAARQSGYDDAGLTLCEGLYSAGGVSGPHFSYDHASPVVPGESCTTGSSSISGIAFNPPSGPLPAEFEGALFFADYARRCIWVMKRDGGPLPSPGRIGVLRAGAPGPVDVQVGPGGDVFYADFDTGAIRRLHFSAGNQAPRAVASASPTNGPTPLTVSFDGRASSDPDPGDALSFAWDLDDDGAFDDGSAAQASYTYGAPGSYAARLRVTDRSGVTAMDTVAVTAGDVPPVATIASPTTGFTWRAGDPIAFEGSAVDARDGRLPASALTWTVTMHHCPSDCHVHSVQSFSGAERGSFPAPDHEYPSYLELRLTARDSAGLTDTRVVRLDPRTVRLSLRSSPSGMRLTVNGTSQVTPFDRTVIQRSVNTISAPSPQTLGGRTYDFSSWSDGGAATHTITATVNGTRTATFRGR